MTKRSIVLCLLMILAAVIATAVYLPGLPERVPMHWNASGQADGYGARAIIWLLGPGLMAATLLLGVLMPWLSPRKFEMQPFAATYGYVIEVLVALFGGVTALLLSNGALDVARAMPAALFVALILIGNPMGKVKRNFFLGVRTPWTLASERVWYLTHRLAGKLMVASGLLGLLAVWLGAPQWADLLLTCAWGLIAVLYSLVEYKRVEGRQGAR